MGLLISIVFIVLVGGIAFILKKGFNEVISRLELIDERLKKSEENTKEKE